MYKVLDFVLMCLLSPSIILAQTLPVFAVTNGFQGDSRARQLIKGLYSNAGTPTYRGSTLVLNAFDNSSVVEIDTLSGGIWSADNTRLWNTSLTKTAEEFGKVNSSTRGSAERYIKSFKLLPTPEKGSPFTFEFAGTSGTFLSKEEGPINSTSLHRENFQLDISANYHARLTLPEKGDIPIIGGGGNFQFTFDSSSLLIGHHGVWRQVQGNGVEYPVIAQNDSDAAFAQATKDIKIVSFNSTLAYYSAPFGRIQNHLYPVYLYHATAQIDNQTVELRETMLPASTFGTELAGLDLKPDCSAPKENSTKPEQPTTQPSNSTGSSRKARRVARRGLDDATWEVGTEWLGKPWGLSLTQSNAAGVRNVLFDFLLNIFSGGIRWTSRFDWGDSLVWESDWDRNDDIYVDNVDLMFYTGHANSNGWVTAAHGSDPTFVDYSIVGTSPQNPGDLWGQLDLEWLVVAACGPHQDDRFVKGGGNAFDRWRGVFDGLHIFLGYGSVTADTDEEGRKLTSYAVGGATIVNSWFRTAKEVQTRGVWVTAMWSGDAGQDHFPGHGSIAADSTASAQRYLMWSQV
ncbi:MAG: hypothetical protein Q9220_007008 [cf. Caloplaca sp. 1 TL-2023]